MIKFKLTIEYDGARFSGWQLQKNERSIQGELIAAAAQIFGTQNIEIYGAGRTDAGVHARGQVAHLALSDTRLSPDQIKIRMNDALVHAINILKVEKAHPKFHARFDAKTRSYTYQISKRRDAFAKKYVWWVKDALDLSRMRAGAALFEGFHDFRSFGTLEKEGGSTMVKLDRVALQETDDRILIHITGSHFLWKMVRRMVGVLVELGRGNLTPEDITGFLTQFSKEPARFTAPPSGLFLEQVTY